MKKLRKIDVQGRMYHWQCSDSFVIIKSMTSKAVVPVNEIAKLDPYTFEKGRWKGNQDGMITPHHIRKWILDKNEETKTIF